jgi:hypothetical protein
MSCCDDFGQCNQGFGRPARSTDLTPVDTDELITRDFINGALFVLAGVVAVACLAIVIYLSNDF